MSTNYVQLFLNVHDPVTQARVRAGTPVRFLGKAADTEDCTVRNVNKIIWCLRWYWSPAQ